MWYRTCACVVCVQCVSCGHEYLLLVAITDLIPSNWAAFDLRVVPYVCFMWPIWWVYYLFSAVGISKEDRLRAQRQVCVRACVVVFFVCTSMN